MTRRMSTPARSDRLGRLVVAVRRQVAWTVIHNQAIADRLGMGVTDLQCVNLLDIEGTMTAGRLAELMGLTTGAVTGVLDRLERGGLLRREADPADRRRVVARLVPEEMERVRTAYAAIGAGVQDLYATFDDAQLALLIDYAERSTEITRRITAELRSVGARQPRGDRGRAIGRAGRDDRGTPRDQRVGRRGCGSGRTPRCRTSTGPASPGGRPGSG